MIMEEKQNLCKKNIYMFFLHTVFPDINANARSICGHIYEYLKSKNQGDIFMYLA